MGRIKDVIIDREINLKAYEELRSIECDKKSNESDD